MLIVDFVSQQFTNSNILIVALQNEGALMGAAMKAFLIIFFLGQSSMAADLGLGQGRLFFGTVRPDPTELNTELTAQGIKTVDSFNHFGIEITFPTFQYLNLGLRYTRSSISQGEVTPNASTGNSANLTQDGLIGVARVPLVKSDFIHFDLFAGAGAKKSAYAEKTASQDGKLEKDTSPVLMGGASIAFGSKKYFLFLEGGYESNKLENMTSSGNLNGNVKTMDLSGSYVDIGIMFEGIPIFTK
jgi:hypothetical protein